MAYLWLNVNVEHSFIPNAYQNKRKKRKAITPLLILLLVAIGVSSVVLGFLLSFERQYSYEFTFRTQQAQAKPFTYGPKPAFADANFFNEVKEKFIQNEITFIEADLSNMVLRFYDEGTVEKEAPIKAKGRKGSWWETPPGLYKALDKIPTHKSSFGPVYMPWNIPFHGNFFIHGWPYYPGGSPATGLYSGGCIRLSVEDAKEIYGLTSVGIPILVFEDNFSKGAGTFAVNIEEPQAEAFLVAEAGSNFVFRERSASEEKPAGWFTSLMAALVASEHLSLEHSISVPEMNSEKERTARYQKGERYTVYELLFPLLHESDDEAARILASGLGEKRLLRLMNEKAQSLGMEKTEFASFKSTDEENVTTARDVYQLAKYLHNYRSFILDIKEDRIRASIFGSPPFSDTEARYALARGEKDDHAPKQTSNQLFVEEGLFETEKRPIVFVALDVLDGAENRTVFKRMLKNLPRIYVLEESAPPSGEQAGAITKEELPLDQGALLVDILDLLQTNKHESRE